MATSTIKNPIPMTFTDTSSALTVVLGYSDNQISMSYSKQSGRVWLGVIVNGSQVINKQIAP